MNQQTVHAETAPSDLQFPVVGIGASAGGLEAVKQFIEAIPAQSGMAYVFVQHLNPTHETLLPEILQKAALIPVIPISDEIHLQPDHFYILPANRIVTAVDGMLKLTPLDDSRHRVKVIDVFFTSLAVVHQSYAVGIILSGMLDDGTAGLQVIKAYGGMTFAQDEASAAFEDMPSNAIRTGSVDFVLSPENIARHLLVVAHPFSENYTRDEIVSAVPEQDQQIFKQLLTVLRVRRGVDFTYYKPSTLKRRIVRRMALNGIDKPADYLNFLRETKAEQDALYNDMLISVTKFFRDSGSFELLCSTILPALLELKKGEKALRIWVAGCATGEEAYSMAICLQELLGDKAATMELQIFATDISETAIAKARTGIYRPADLTGISPLRLTQFFTKLDGSYQVNKSVRDLCIFAHHNFLKDSPFSKIDLVSCRNVLIYLEPVLQKRALTTFHYSLQDKGFLMLGKSESIGQHTDLYTPYIQTEKFYQRKGSRGRYMQVTSLGGEQKFRDIDAAGQREGDGRDIFKLADALALEMAPAGVLLNEHFDIIQFRGNTDSWLAVSPGKATLNVLKMVRDGLSFEIRNLLHTAKRTGAATGKENILYQLNGAQQEVKIMVSPITSLSGPHYLVLFEKTVPAVARNPANGTANGDDPDPIDCRIAQLEKELMQNRQDMCTITEEQEGANEELQMANEELLSGSEELQSLNEELETSKEELQSTNEEIMIVNNELLERNEQLNNARRYSEGIINTIRDPLLILDKELIIKRATEGFYSKFLVSEKQTEGRYLYDLGNGQWNIPALRTLLQSVIADQQEFIDFEVAHVFPAIGRVVMRLNARLLDKINGEQLILLAIEDITAKRKVEEGLAEVERLFEESKERLKLAVDTAGLGIWDYNPITGQLICDHRCQEMFGILTGAGMDYIHLIDSIHPEDRDQVDQYFKHILGGMNNGEYEKEFRTSSADSGKFKWIKFKGQAYFNADGIVDRFVGTSLDVSMQKQMDEATRELLKQKDDFISIASHELKTPITTLTASLQLLNKMKDDPAPKKLPEMVDRANRSLDKVNILIKDLLNVAQLNTGVLNLNRSYFNLYDRISTCWGDTPAEGGYQMSITGDKSLEVYGDADRIDQVITNLVSNAIKYAPDSKHILISIESLAQEVKVSVSDKGAGIPSDQIAHLFERYYRVEKEGRTYSGLGLGLYICAEIVKKHQGRIGAESEINRGSTFWFTLPL